MTRFALNIQSLQEKARRIRARGDELRTLSASIKVNGSIQEWTPALRAERKRIEKLADQVKRISNQYINLANALDDIIKHTISTDQDNEAYIRRVLSQVDDVESNPTPSYSAVNQPKSELNKVWDQVFLGDYAEEFNVIGFGINIGLGFTPVGILQDLRDLSHTFVTMNERDAWTNAGLIGLGIIGFVPVFGDVAKLISKPIKAASTTSKVIKGLTKTDDVTKAYIKAGQKQIAESKLLSNNVSLAKNAETYSTLVNGNIKFSWADNFSDGDKLKSTEQKNIKQYAVDQGLIPTVEFKSYIDSNGVTWQVPDFEGAGLVLGEVKIDKQHWKAKDDIHFIQANLEFEKKYGYSVPAEGYTWHHDTIKPGNLQLVPFGIHNVTHHKGPRALGGWAEGGR